jgi:hypothetical protein
MSQSHCKKEAIMKKLTMAISIWLGLLLSSNIALADGPFLLKVPSLQSGYTSIPSGATTVWDDNSHTVSIGKDQTSCFRFESLSVPQHAFIESADIQVTCKNCSSSALRLSVCGEYTQPSSPLTGADFNLSDRVPTRNCSQPIAGKVSNNPYALTSALQEIVDNEHWVSGNNPVICFLDRGSTAKSNVLSAATLTVSYSLSGGGGGTDPLDCVFYTNNDEFPDLNLEDADSDGYCDLPIGNSDFFGTLVLDRPVEVLGAEAAGGNGLAIAGYQIRLVAPGNVISDLQSSTVSTLGQGRKDGVLLELKAQNNITLLGALISNLGATVAEAGDLNLITDTWGGNILVDAMSIYAEDIKVESRGSLEIKGQSEIGTYGNVRLAASEETGTHNLTVAGTTVIYTMDKGKVSFENQSLGKVVLRDQVVISTEIIDFCKVRELEIGPDVQLNADSVLMPLDSACGL